MPWNLSYTIADDAGAVQTWALKVVQDTDITFEHILLAANELGELLDPAIEGIVTSVNVNFSMAPGWIANDTPGANSDVEEGALLTFNCADTTYTHSNRIPAFLQSLFNGKVVNTASPAADNLISGILAGFTVDPGGDEHTVVFGDNYDNAYTSLRRAVKSFRK